MFAEYFRSKTDNSETEMTNFFQSVCTNSVSIDLIERELSSEKIKRSTLDNDKREMKRKMKELVEKLNATEILIDISNAAIQVLEKTIKDSDTFGSSGGLFRQPVQTQNPGLFGKSAPSTATIPAFNFGASTETSLFQQNNLQKPLFGQTTVGTGIFGSTTTAQQSTGFGTNTAISSFGAKSQQTPLLSQTTGGTGLFGGTATTQQSTLFGTHTAISSSGTKSQQTITVASVSSDAPTENENSKKKTCLEEKSKEELVKIVKEQFNFLQKFKEISNGVPPLESNDDATKPQESVEKKTTPDSNATPKSFTVTKESSMPFSSSTFSTFSFSDIAIDFGKLSKSPEAGKIVFSGARTSLPQNLNTSAEKGAAIESQESVAKTSTPDTNATPKSSTLTLESSMPFSRSSFNTFSFTDIFSNTGFEKLAKSPASGKKGARTPFYQNLNTSAKEGTDEVAPNPDIHFEPVIPLPDLIEVKTGEEDETPLFIFRSKLFRYDPNTKQWKERGIGDIKILSHKEKMRFRIILRRDQVHNVACNHCITEEMSLTPLSTSENALCWTAMDFSDGKGEATQFAVRFKHKEQTQQFKEVFLDCQEKLRNCKETSVEEKVAAIAQNVEPVGASGAASATEESVIEDKGDDEEEESDELIFEKRVTLEVFDDSENKFKVEGMGYLKIVYDDSSFGYRVFMEADDGRLLCEHLIAVQTCLRTDGKTAIWAAIDYCIEPVTRRQFRVTFSSMEALNEFSKHFEEGKEIAFISPIVEKSY